MPPERIAAVGIGCRVSASSCWATDHDVDRIRLNYTTAYGSNSWCAKYNDTNQWVQLHLGSDQRLVTEIKTQGRNGCNQWVKKFKVQISDDGINWESVEGGKEFIGNSDQNTIVSNKLTVPVKCRAIRICPT